MEGKENGKQVTTSANWNLIPLEHTLQRYPSGRVGEPGCLFTNSHSLLAKSCSWEEFVSYTLVLPCTQAQMELVARGTQVTASKSQTEIQVSKTYGWVSDSVSYNIQCLNKSTSMETKRNMLI